MRPVFDYHSRRARLARLSLRLPSRLITALSGAALLLAIGGGLLVFVDWRPGAWLVAIAALWLQLWLWYKGQLAGLPALGTTPGSDGRLPVHQLLDKSVLGRLPPGPSVSDIWKAIKPNWQRQFLSVRFGLVESYFESLADQPQLQSDWVWNEAWRLQQLSGQPSISAGALTLALFSLVPARQPALDALRLDESDLLAGLEWLNHLAATLEAGKQRHHYGGIGRDWAAGYTPLLNRLGHNVSASVQAGGLWVRPTESHDRAVNQMLTLLSKSPSGSVALVGETGVGKTTAVYALAQKLLIDKVPSLRYHQIYNLNAADLIAQASAFSSLEQLILGLFAEASRAGNIILFLDEAQLFLQAGTGSVDLSALLLQLLQTGRVHLICALTPGQWQLLNANHSSLTGLLNYLLMPAAGEQEAIEIMLDHIPAIENRHNCVFTYQAVKEAKRLADKYLPDLAQPGRGLRLLEQAAVGSQGGLISVATIGQVLESSLGVKVVQPAADEKQKLIGLEDELHRRLINQVRAVSVVANALRRARSGVASPSRPAGTFLFLGPTGVGKTELAKALADVYFGGRSQLIRLNLNEYVQASDASRLIAAVSQDSSGGFLAQVRRQPYSVVLMDEIEKAHPDVLNLLLQLLDEGIIKDSQEREVSFRDAIIIATSNAGADVIRQQIDAGRNLPDFEDEFINQLIDKQHFRPEFLNRFDEVVLFRPLTAGELAQVVALMIAEVNQTLASQRVAVRLSQGAIDWLVNKGNDPRLGARPMRRMVTRSVENLVARRLLDGSAGPGTTIVLDASDLASAP